MALPVPCLPRPLLHLGGIKWSRGSCETCVSESTALTHPTAASQAVGLMLTPQTAWALGGSVYSQASSWNVFASFLTEVFQPNRTGKAAGSWGAGGRRCPPPGPERRVQAVPVALVNEEPVLYRAECNTSSGFALRLHGGRRPPGAVREKRDPEDARGASLPGEPPQLPRGWGCEWRHVLGLRARCWDLAGTGNT